MQVLTPEQAKLMWSAFDEVAKWCVTAITLWLLGSLRKSYKALQHTLGVLRGLPAQFEAHRAEDTANFQAINAKLDLNHAADIRRNPAIQH